MPKPDEERLFDMMTAADKAIEFTAGKRRADLDQDELLALALVRPLEILGEAAKYVSEETRNASPEIPWREIAGTRDRLIHGYYSVDLDIIWSIIKNDLPPLRSQLLLMLEGE